MATSNLKEYFSLLRLKDWPAHMAIALLGFAFAQGYWQHPINIFLFLILLFSSLGFGFSINQYSDVREDGVNPLKKNPVANGKIKPRNALTFALILWAVGIVISAYFGQIALAFYALLSLTAFFYSMAPLRLKTRAVMDLISTGLYAGTMLFLLSFFLFGSQITALDWIIASSIFYTSVMLEFANHLQDYKWDKKAKVKTTVTEIGLEKSEKIVKFMVFTFPLFVLAIGIYLNSLLVVLPTLIFYPIFYFRTSAYSKNNYRLLGVYVILTYAIALLTYTLADLIYGLKILMLILQQLLLGI